MKNDKFIKLTIRLWIVKSYLSLFPLPSHNAVQKPLYQGRKMVMYIRQSSVDITDIGDIRQWHNFLKTYTQRLNDKTSTYKSLQTPPPVLQQLENSLERFHSKLRQARCCQRIFCAATLLQKDRNTCILHQVYRNAEAE